MKFSTKSSIQFYSQSADILMPAHHIHPDKRDKHPPKTVFARKRPPINLSSILENAVQQPGVQVGIRTATPNERYRVSSDGGSLIYLTARVW